MDGEQSSHKVTNVSRAVILVLALASVMVCLGTIAFSVTSSLDEANIVGTYRTKDGPGVAFLILREDRTFEEAYVDGGYVFRNSGRWSYNPVDRPHQVILEGSFIDFIIKPSNRGTRSWQIGFDFAPPVGTITLRIDYPDGEGRVLKQVSSEQTVPETWNAK